MFHFCYKTTNVVNGHFYIGKHSTSNLNDGYLGSGDLLQKAIKKYGKENFKREIIQFFDTEEDAFAFEETLIENWMIKSDECYNLKGGGDGVGAGENHPNFGRVFTEETRRKMSSSHAGDKSHMWGKPMAESTKNKLKAINAGNKNPMFGVKHDSETIKRMSGENNHRWNKPHSPETLEKMRAAALNVRKLNCSHCGKVVIPGVYVRFHGDKCKQK